nr:ATP-binding cassette domain-containing protein [Maliibacterium massiliense]
MIQVKELTKQFRARGAKVVLAVDHISFEVRPGEIFGLLGRNGAGKTTTLRMLAGMLQPTEGTALVCGHDIVSEARQARAQMGILFGGEAGLYDRLTARENIAYFAELCNVPKGEVNARVEKLAASLELSEYLDRRAGKLSKGNRQKTVFARAIVHNPQVMLFDEPTSGLDVSAIRHAQDFIYQCRGEGKSIILSSHVMGEVERLCDRVGIIDHGRIRAIGTQEELKAKYGCQTLEQVFEKRIGEAL